MCLQLTFSHTGKKKPGVETPGEFVRIFYPKPLKQDKSKDCFL